MMACVIAVFFWRHQAEIAARHAQAQARLDIITKQGAHIADLRLRYRKLGNTFTAAKRQASGAGKKRHDSDDANVIRLQAKKELASVIAMEETLPSIQLSLNALSDGYADVLGREAVAGFRSTADPLLQTQSLSLNRWWRASVEITDWAKGDQSIFSDALRENVTHLYDESADYETRADTLNNELNRKLIDLEDQVQSRIDQVKRDLEAAR